MASGQRLLFDRFPVRAEWPVARLAEWLAAAPARWAPAGSVLFEPGIRFEGFRLVPEGNLRVAKKTRSCVWIGVCDLV